jgi:hypothetical protein
MQSNRAEATSMILRGALVTATVAIAVVNGLPVRPFFDSVSHVLYLFTRGSRLLDPDHLYYLTTLAIAVMTLVVAGIPAALYERARGLRQSTPVSLGIWLAATVLLSHRALLALADLW